ncbi:hypothetical protein [Saccharopolyspora hattusasensis]|uniref:hypothetical protein n=1 Tax=Saccharopolyspora hattusasensis TaxID=1128679 RepID=UPI003D9970E2
MSAIVRTAVAGALLVGLAACHEPGHSTTSGSDVNKPAISTGGQQRFRPDPSEWTAEGLGGYDQPGEYAASCNDDGTVANYWPDTAPAWRDAVNGCKEMAEYSRRLVDELNRRDPDAGWH